MPKLGKGTKVEIHEVGVIKGVFNCETEEEIDALIEALTICKPILNLLHRKSDAEKS